MHPRRFRAATLDYVALADLLVRLLPDPETYGRTSATNWPSAKPDGAQVTALADGAHLFLSGAANPAYLGQLYRKRWAIEACFQNPKRRGFAFRGTHVQYRTKLRKIVGPVSFA